MANNILMVSIIDGKIDLLNLKRHVKSYQLADQPIFDVDQATLEEKCKKARDIYITSDFPSANYYWGRFPKVGRRFIKEIVVREARQNFGYVGAVRAAFQDVGQTVETGVPKRLLACSVVDHSEVFPIEQEIFGKFQHKISNINTLPTALSAAVSQVERCPGDFMVISVGESSTTMAISSPRGDVKVSRQIPLGFGKEDDPNDADRCKVLFNEIAKDITNTNLYYLQNFQGSECNLFYMFGNPSLQAAMAKYGADILPGMHFGFSRSPFSSIDKDQAAAWVYLFGALYCHRNYNLLSPKITLTRNLNLGYRYAMTVIVAGIVGCGLYLYQIDPVGVDRITKYKESNARLAISHQEVSDLKRQVNTLNQFSGWKSFYRNTYKNQPAWNTLFSEMANCLPKEIVIETFRIDPGSASRDVRSWNCFFTGRINVKEWDNGLELLREFGAKINRSHNFEITKVRYAPTLDEDNRPTEDIGFDFQVTAQLIPQDSG